MKNQERPESFKPILLLIQERSRIVDKIIKDIKSNLENISKASLFPIPSQINKDIETCIRDHCVICRRYQIFSEMIKNKEPKDLSDAELKNIYDFLRESLCMGKEVREKWDNIQYELNAWIETVDALSDILEIPNPDMDEED